MTRTWVRMKWMEDGTRERRNRIVLWEKCGRSFLLEFSTQQYLKLTINTSLFVLFLAVHTKRFTFEHLGLSLLCCSVCVTGRGWRWAPPTSHLFLKQDGLPGLQTQHGWGTATGEAGLGTTQVLRLRVGFVLEWLEWVRALLAGGYQGTSQRYHSKVER